MKAKIFVLSASVALELGVMVSAQAQTTQEVDRVRQEALRWDAEFISSQSGEFLEDVYRRLRLQVASGDLTAKLREEFKERFAGIYREHDPYDRIIVRLTGEIPVESRKIQFNNDTLHVDFVIGQPHGKMQLQDLIKDSYDTLRKFFPELQGIGSDDKTGEIVLHIYSKDGNPETIKKLHAIARDILGVPVRIKLHSSKAERFNSVIAGGSLPVIQCTSGFSVRNISTKAKGIITANHCLSGNTVYQGQGSTLAIPFIHQTGLNTPSEDVRWYKPFFWYSNIPIEPKFYGPPLTPVLTVTGSKSQASTQTGDIVCHTGTTTGYSCGVVAETSYMPTFSCGTDFSFLQCANTWILVIPSIQSGGLGCFGGDSGGPVVIGTLAAGILQGGSSKGPTIGSCEYFTYMSIDRINVLNLELMHLF